MSRVTQRHRMDELAEQIAASVLAEPENFDAREHLWQERENLRASLSESKVAA